MDTVGPRRITQVRQVAIPARLLTSVGLEVGSQVYFAITESEPRRIVLIPADEVNLAAGRLV